MGYRNLQRCLRDLAASGQLVRISEPVDPCLEAAEIQRRVYAHGGPAIQFDHVTGCSFPMVSNLYGTLERARYLFRDRLEAVRRMIELQIDPAEFLRRPFRYSRVPWYAWGMVPRRCRRGPILAHQTTIEQLPQMKSWPEDGGAFITLPLVYSEDVNSPGLLKSNLGMYRIQISGGRYEPNRQIGLHYQLHRNIGVHHAEALRQGQPFRVNIFVGGAPAMTLAAIMPLPEGLSELTFAGILGGHRVPMIAGQPSQASDGSFVAGLPIYAEADFCITGTVDNHRQLPEGPFGDHLGYYSLAHDFPVLQVERVYHRRGAIWPFTVVGRPPQEDTVFGALIHELTGPIIPSVLPGVRAVHAVDPAGVHPLLLAIGTERYTPYNPLRRPQELLTQAHAILGQGQLSLAKYLLIVADEGQAPDIHDIVGFFTYLLRRVDWRRDLHFQTQTTCDTLDYSSHGFNQGSKLVIAGAGPPLRELPSELPAELALPPGFAEPQLCLPGVLAVKGPSCEQQASAASASRFCEYYSAEQAINRFPLVTLVDDSCFAAAKLHHFLWVVFTRSDPAADVHGIGSFHQEKHWGCRGSLVIDARSKPHHAPPLVEDPEIVRRVDAMAARGGPLARYL